LVWPSWRVQGEGQRDHRRRPGPLGGAAGHPGAVAPAALDERKHLATSAGRLPPGWPHGFSQRGDDLQPGGILPGRVPRGAGTPDPVGLGDPGHHAAEPEGSVAHREQVGRVDAAPGTVSEREQEQRLRPAVDDRSRGPV
jgi:hypothetical protein